MVYKLSNECLYLLEARHACLKHVHDIQIHTDVLYMPLMHIFTRSVIIFPVSTQYIREVCCNRRIKAHLRSSLAQSVINRISDLMQHKANVHTSSAGTLRHAAHGLNTQSLFAPQWQHFSTISLTFRRKILSETLINPHLVHDALNENSFNYIYPNPVKANFN